jgi:hypothetical protein
MISKHEAEENVNTCRIIRGWDRDTKPRSQKYIYIGIKNCGVKGTVFNVIYYNKLIDGIEDNFDQINLV